MNTSIAVLAGGQSRRMGQDKALLDFLGEPLLNRVLRRIRHLTDDLFLVTPPRPGYEQFGTPLVPDLLPECGPLGGILTALQTARYPYCLILSCDLPFVNPQLLAAMLAWPRPYDVLVPVRNQATGQGGEQTLETLHAIYSKRCIEPISRRLTAGERKIVSFFPEVSVVQIPEADLRRYDPKLLSFVNANTPEAYQWVLAHAMTVEPRNTTAASLDSEE